MTGSDEVNEFMAQLGFRQHFDLLNSFWIKGDINYKNCIMVDNNAAIFFYHQFRIRELRCTVEEVNDLTIKLGSYNDGCGCCSRECIREWDALSGRYSGEIRVQWLKDHIADLNNQIAELEGGKRR